VRLGQPHPEQDRTEGMGGSSTRAGPRGRCGYPSGGSHRWMVTRAGDGTTEPRLQTGSPSRSPSTATESIVVRRHHRPCAGTRPSPGGKGWAAGLDGTTWARWESQSVPEIRRAQDYAASEPRARDLDGFHPDGRSTPVRGHTSVATRPPPARHRSIQSDSSQETGSYPTPTIASDSEQIHIAPVSGSRNSSTSGDRSMAVSGGTSDTPMK
jgi:hypothetical protein